MLLRDLCMMEFVNDDTTIIASRPIIGNISDIRKGEFYTDMILDLMDFHVRKFDYDVFENQLSVSLYKEN